jgi:hypothetical protein
MKSIREMTADTEANRSEIKKLIETDPKAEQIYIEIKAELSAARQLCELDNKTYARLSKSFTTRSVVLQ